MTDKEYCEWKKDLQLLEVDQPYKDQQIEMANECYE